MSLYAWAVVFIIAGIILITIELFSPGVYIGVIGFSLLVGGLVGLIYLPQFWLMFAIGLFVTLVVASLIFHFLYKKTGSFKSSPAISIDALIGKKAIVIEKIDNVAGTGRVRVGDDIWRAKSDRLIEAGQEVLVERIEGAALIVKS